VEEVGPSKMIQGGKEANPVLSVARLCGGLRLQACGGEDRRKKGNRWNRGGEGV
jgi:hypothetical protein